MAGKVWHKVASSVSELNWTRSRIAVVEVEDKKICIVEYKDKLYGFSLYCPHASGLFSDGYLDVSGNIVCPVHGYKFNIRNGRNTSGEGFQLKTYEVEKRDDGIFARARESGGLFSWLK